MTASRPSRVQVDLRVPVGLPIPRLTDFIARCEDAGFDGVGVHDHPHSGRDVYLTLALAAARTRRLRLYPATSSPVVRHPLVLASLTHSLDEIAPGRVGLTVAPGFLAARSLGRPRASLAAMREAVLTIRRLLAGETVAVGAGASRLRNLSRPAPPVYLLAAGPRMVELAGEVADGALVLVGLDPEAVRAAREHLAEGARRAGRTLPGFPVVFVVPVAVEATVAAAARWAQRWAAPGHPWLTYPSAANLYWLRRPCPIAGPRRDPGRAGRPHRGGLRAVRAPRALPRAPAPGAGGGRRRARLPLPGPHPGGGLRDAGGRAGGLPPRDPPRARLGDSEGGLPPPFRRPPRQSRGLRRSAKASGPASPQDGNSRTRS